MSKHGKRNRGLVKRGNGVSQKPEIVFAAFVMKEGDRLVAVGAMDGSGEVDLSGVTTIRPDEAQEGEFIVGVVPRNKLEPVHVVASAVQVVPWTAFKESEPGKSIVEYIASKPTGELTPKYKSFLGTKNKATDIIVHDGNTYLKGFLSTGGCISYSHVKTFAKDFRNANKGVEIRYRDGNDFTLLVKKPYDAKGKHPVLDCDGWKALLGGLRVFELAKMSGVTYSDVQEVANAEGIPCWSPISLIDRDEAERLLKVLAGKNNEAVKEKRENKRIRLRELDQVLHEENDKKLNEHLQTAKEVGKHGWKDLPVTEKTKPMVTTGLLKAIDESAEKSGLFAIPRNQVQNPPRGDSDAEGRRRDMDERDFLKSFEDYVFHKCGFSYEVRDLIRFHTSMKCSRLVVLGGAPGCGKSSLAKLYFRFLASRMADSESLFIAVNPAWVEPADILGIRNLTGNFVDANCGLVKFIRKAMANKKALYPVCLEEMNLAPAEHYFSDFLQVLSQDDNDDAEIPGYEAAGLSENATKAPLFVSGNLRFVGTCNFDVTTHPFSPRFYDRCAYLELSSSVPKFAKSMPSLCDMPSGVETISLEDFLHGWKPQQEEVVEAVEKSFDELCPLLVEADIAPSPRVLAKIRKYILSRPHLDDKLDEVGCDEAQKAALDEALAQYVFPRYLPATSAKLRKEQDSLKDYLDETNLPLCSALLKSIDKRFGGYSLS